MSAAPYRGTQDRRNNNNGANVASLEQLMTAPPMSAAAHADLQQRRIATRRRLEDLRESRAIAADSWATR